jgi:hypothetical protein
MLQVHADFKFFAAATSPISQRCGRLEVLPSTPDKKQPTDIPLAAQRGPLEMSPLFLDIAKWKQQLGSKMRGYGSFCNLYVAGWLYLVDQAIQSHTVSN